MTPLSNPAFAPVIAAHRFGLGEARLDALAGDPRGWLLSQIGPADAPWQPPGSDALASAGQGLMHQRKFLRRAATAATAASAASQAEAGSSPDDLRDLVLADLRSRLGTAARTRRPFAERLVMFWSNHFTVSNAKTSARGLAGAFEREAIRPHIAGPFEALLLASTRHAAMLRYLDNEQSAGPNSRLVQRLARRAGPDARPRISGLNENLAREVLELHTLGAAAARQGLYTQADVTAFAAVLTGWRAAPDGDGSSDPVRFDPAWHEPGPKTVLGRRYPEGEAALPQVLHDLARHPATARHVCTRLAQALVADAPPPALVAALEAAWQRSDGDLGAVTRALVEAPAAWQLPRAKLKSPEEFVVSTARLLGQAERAFERTPDGGIASLGQRVMAAPSPAGWPDVADEWLGPDAVWKRVEWATRLGERLGRTVDARALATAAFGTALDDGTRQQVERAADGAQALALLLLSPDFQRR